MSRASANEVVKGKLYQRGQFLTWPHAQKHRMLKEFGITFVVNLWSKVDPDLSATELDRVYLNWHCSPSEVPPNHEVLIDVIARAIEGGHVALIHCEAGRGRSVWLAARVMHKLNGMTGKEVLKEIERAVPNENLTDTLRRDIAQLR